MIKMGKEYLCDICEKRVFKRVRLEDGKKVCELCYNKIEVENVLDVGIPKVIKWIGKCAKQGKNLLFLIPQGQKPFFKHKEKYIIVVRKLK